MGDWNMDRPTRQKITITDVAEMAHVSKVTVSRVLNGAPVVGEKTRQRILKLIDSLDFQPDAFAQGLASHRTNTLGFVIPHTGSYAHTSTFYPLFLTSVVQEAAAHGMNVLISTATDETDADSAFRAILRGRRINGVIVGAEQFGGAQLKELLTRNVPFVMIGRSGFAPTHYVDVDHIAGARAAAEHLVANGHDRIAILAGPRTLPYVDDRVRGVVDVYRERGLPSPAVVHCTYEAREATVAVQDTLRRETDVTAIFAAAGDFVAPLFRACAGMGRSIPHDLSLVAFDDHPLFELLTPAITAVAQPVDEIVMAAVKMLLDLIAGKQPEREAVVVTPGLVLRASCERARRP